MSQWKLIITLKSRKEYSYKKKKSVEIRMGMIFDLCFGSLIGNKKHITRTSKNKIKNLSIKYDPSLFKTEEFTQQ